MIDYDTFLREKKGLISSSAYKYQLYANIFLQWSHEKKNDFGTIDELINAFILHLRTKTLKDLGKIEGLKTDTINSYLCAIEHYYEFIGSPVIIAKLKHGSKIVRPADFLSNTELKIFIDYLKPDKNNPAKLLYTTRLNAIFWLFYIYAPCVRVIHELNLSDVDLEKNEIILAGGKVTLAPNAKKSLQEYIRWRAPEVHKDPALFINQYRVRLSIRGIEKHFEKAFREAGIRHRTPYNIIQTSIKKLSLNCDNPIILSLATGRKTTHTVKNVLKNKEAQDLDLTPLPFDI